MNRSKLRARSTAWPAALLLFGGMAMGPALAQDDEGYGLVPEDPIEVCRNTGQREYLNQLRCTDGSTPEQNRVGNVGPRTEPQTIEEEDLAWDQSASYDPLPEGVTDFHVLDMYTLECGDEVIALYFDSYHCPQAQDMQAPPGLSLAEPEPAAHQGAGSSTELAR